MAAEVAGWSEVADGQHRFVTMNEHSKGVRIAVKGADGVASVVVPHHEFRLMMLTAYDYACAHKIAKTWS